MKTIFNLKLHQMRTLLTALALFLFTGSIFSQNISVEEAVLARQNNLYPSNLDQLKWLKEENSYSYVKENNLIIGSTKGKEKTALTLEKLNKITGYEMVRTSGLSVRTFTECNVIVSVKYQVWIPNLKKISSKRFLHRQNPRVEVRTRKL